VAGEESQGEGDFEVVFSRPRHLSLRGLPLHAHGFSLKFPSLFLM